MFCPQCGNEMPVEATFCSSCGHQLKKIRKHAAATAKARRIALYICVAFLLLIMVTPTLVTYTFYDSNFNSIDIGEEGHMGFFDFLIPPTVDIGALASLIGMGLVIAGIVLELRKKNASTTLLIVGFVLMFFGFQFLQNQFQWVMYGPEVTGSATLLGTIDSGGGIEVAQFVSLLALVLVLVGRLGVSGTVDTLKDRLDDSWEFLRATDRNKKSR